MIRLDAVASLPVALRKARAQSNSLNEHHRRSLRYHWGLMSVKEATPSGINKNDGKESISPAHGGQYKGFVAGVFSGVAKLSVG